MKSVLRLSLLGLACALAAGCSVLEGEKIDYKSAGKGTSLEVPPDLTQLSRDTRYVVPGSGSITASAYQVGMSAPTLPAATMAVGDVRVERQGNQRWLVVNRPADQLWGSVRDFWQDSGFLLAMDEPNLGIMETDWAENRAKLPQDFIRSTLSKLFDSLYSTPERDRFRTRMERNAAGGTDIYVTHRGMQEVYSDGSKTQTVWQPRPADPELEAEFLRRLMVRLGLPNDAARTAVAQAPGRATSRVTSAGNQPAVEIDDGFDRAWRRVGLSLDRTGFTVEDRDRANGIYFVRYVELTADRKEPGFFAKLFGSDKDASAPVKYRIALRSQGEKTTVTVQNASGAPEASVIAQRIVKQLADDLK